MPWTTTRTAEGKPRTLTLPRFSVQLRRGSRCDLTSVGNSVFWRGAKITPRFATKKNRDVEDVRSNVR